MDNRNTKEILWANICTLMSHAYGREWLSGFAKDTGIGNATMTRIKERDTHVRTETLEKIAQRFDLAPWQLLVPGMAAPPAGELSEIPPLDHRPVLGDSAVGPNVGPSSQGDEMSEFETRMLFNLMRQLSPDRRIKLAEDLMKEITGGGELKNAAG